MYIDECIHEKTELTVDDWHLALTETLAFLLGGLLTCDIVIPDKWWWNLLRCSVELGADFSCFWSAGSNWRSKFVFVCSLRDKPSSSCDGPDLYCSLMFISPPSSSSSNASSPSTLIFVFSTWWWWWEPLSLSLEFISGISYIYIYIIIINHHNWLRSTYAWLK